MAWGLRKEKGWSFTYLSEHSGLDTAFLHFLEHGAVPEHFDGVDVFINKGQPPAEFLRIVREVIERYCS